MRNLNVLISGAGIAGPSLAHCLRQRGFSATVVERAPALRDGGSAVDFRGEQMEVLRRMRILEAVRAKETAMGQETVIDADGKPMVVFPSSFFSGEVEIARGDLTRILYDHTREFTEYLFGDWITALAQTADGVEVSFAHAASRRFDLVVGADGLHSAVRRLAFGDESKFRTDMGYHIAGFDGPNLLGLDRTGVVYNEPGRGVMVSSSRDRAKAGVSFVFTSPESTVDRHDVLAQKETVAKMFAGVGWQTARFVEAMWQAPDLYFDSLSQIHLDRWSAGRVVLLGDAAWCGGPGSSGTGMAMMGAYVLAAELARAGERDFAGAFARYEERLRPGATRGQKQAKGAGPFLAPPTEKKIRQRNRFYRMLSHRLLARVFAKITGGAANAVSIKDYPR
jgi:2-polyprenyl-6-methoxyphenol hydroxylase-like FAD-dependent oxidoreductase